MKPGHRAATSKLLWLASVAFQGDTLVASFTNGKKVSVNVNRYRRLARSPPAQRAKWRLIGNGLGIHWKDLDEDLSVENLLFASAKATV